MLPEDSSSEKPKRTVTTLRSLTPSETGKSLADRDLEQQAIWVEKEMAGVRYKLREMSPVLPRIREHFHQLAGSKKFRGCSGWEEYCDKKLHVTAAAVRMMEMRLKGKPVQKPEKKKRPTKSQHEYEQNLTEEDVMFMRTGLYEAMAAREAQGKSAWKDAEAHWVEFDKIAKAPRLMSTLVGDQPNYKVMLIDLVIAIDQWATAQEQVITALKKIPDSIVPPEALGRLTSCMEQVRKVAHA
jgi:hypothetical protein